MYKLKLLFVALALGTFSSLVMAQSSGNFSAATLNSFCTLDTSKGTLSNPCVDGTGVPSDKTLCAMLPAPIKVSNGKGLVLAVTPSMVTGLFTSTTINTTVTTATADIGIQVCLSVANPDGSPAAGVTIYPTNPATGQSCVTYDQRFQQLSSSFFSTLAACVAVPCTVPAAGAADPCTAAGEGTCVPNVAGGGAGSAGTCSLPNPNCNLTLILSTLSAHSFNFVVTLPGGNYIVEASWTLQGVVPTGGKNGTSTVAACVGPGTLTVTQGKVFTNSGGLLTFP